MPTQILLIALLAAVAAGGLVWFGWGLLDRVGAALRARKDKKAP